MENEDNCDIAPLMGFDGEINVHALLAAIQLFIFLPSQSIH